MYNLKALDLSKQNAQDGCRPVDTINDSRYLLNQNLFIMT
jgi:hypothetical protein